MTDEDRARIKAEARATLQRLAHLAPREASEDSLERWARLKPQPEEPRRERGLDVSPVALVDQRIGAWLEAERQKQADVLADMQGELGAALAGIADALGTIDARLRALEAQRSKKAANGASRQPLTVPNFLEPRIQ
jgi:hypothetical protein